MSIDQYRRQRAELACIEGRNRHADDLRDDVAQLLFGAQLAVEAVLESNPLAAVGAELDEAGRLVAHTEGALRDVITQWTTPLERG